MNSDEILAAVRATRSTPTSPTRTSPPPCGRPPSAAGSPAGRCSNAGCGTGIFISQAPPAAKITGVELDLITAQIATALHPAATIYCESFAETRLPAGSVDLVIGNVPFGDFPMGGRDPVTPWAGKYSIHNHCLVKALHLLRPGGLLIALTSRYTADAVTADKARREMASLADLIGAVRLPANSHQAAAGTKVVMDVLMLRRRAPGDPDRGLPWAEAAHVKVDGCEVALNQVFRRGGGGQVLGKLAVTSTGHGPDLTVTPGKGDLPKLIARALGQAADEARAPGIGWAPAGEVVVPIGQRADTALPEGHIIPGLGGTFTIVDDGQLAPFGVPAAHVTELKDLCALRDTIRGLLAAEAATCEDTPQIAELRDQLGRVTTRRTGGTARSAGSPGGVPAAIRATAKRATSHSKRNGGTCSKARSCRPGARTAASPPPSKKDTARSGHGRTCCSRTTPPTRSSSPWKCSTRSRRPPPRRPCSPAGSSAPGCSPATPTTPPTRSRSAWTSTARSAST